MESNSQTIVVGGGLAGLSCAFELAEQGGKPLVFEASQILGGRTSSWVEQGMPVESGLHKFLGIYRALPDLLERAGVDLNQLLTWVDKLAFWFPGGPNAEFTIAPYRHPLGTTASALGNTDFLPLADKAKLAAMGTAGMAKAASAPLELDQVSIAQYARKWKLSEQIIERVISTSTQAALFLPAEEFSAFAAFAPVMEGAKRGMTMRLGAFNGGMTDLMINPLVRKIEELGGEVRRGAKVSQLMVDKGAVTGVKLNGQVLTARHVVLATSLKPAQDLLRPLFASHEWFQGLLSLPSLSAATIQFELDAPLLDNDQTNFSSTSLCCFAEQSRTTFRHVPGRCSAILYPPGKFLEMGEQELLEQVTSAADALDLPLRGHIQRYRIIHHPNDFYAMRPGTEQLRPEQTTPIPGLSLAGDYTRQNFSASMEGAVISGQLAAQGIMIANGEVRH